MQCHIPPQKSSCNEPQARRSTKSSTNLLLISESKKYVRNFAGHAVCTAQLSLCRTIYATDDSGLSLNRRLLLSLLPPSLNMLEPAHHSLHSLDPFLRPLHVH